MFDVSPPSGQKCNCSAFRRQVGNAAQVRPAQTLIPHFNNDPWIFWLAVWHIATLTDQWLCSVWITDTGCPAAAVCQQQHWCKTNIDANLVLAGKPIYFSFTEQMKTHLSHDRSVKVKIFLSFFFSFIKSPNVQFSGKSGTLSCSKGFHVPLTFQKPLFVPLIFIASGWFTEAIQNPDEKKEKVIKNIHMPNLSHLQLLHCTHNNKLKVQGWLIGRRLRLHAGYPGPHPLIGAGCREKDCRDFLVKMHIQYYQSLNMVSMSKKCDFKVSVIIIIIIIITPHFYFY